MTRTCGTALKLLQFQKKQENSRSVVHSERPFEMPSVQKDGPRRLPKGKQEQLIFQFSYYDGQGMNNDGVKF
jgi:hypothetical protein